MTSLLPISVPFLMGATLIRAAISQGLKIQAIMQGVEPQTDWILIGMVVVTVIVTCVAVSQMED